jgi:hypothetical protein
LLVLLDSLAARHELTALARPPQPHFASER